MEMTFELDLKEWKRTVGRAGAEGLAPRTLPKAG